MSLFVFHETTVDKTGVKTTKERINWKLIILIAIVLLAIGGVAGYLISRAGNGETAGNLPVIAPPEIKPPVSQTTPQDNPKGRIWTVKELTLEILDNPGKYKWGTIFQVSGVYTQYKYAPGEMYKSTVYLGPPTYRRFYGDDLEIWIIIIVDPDTEKELLKTWLDLDKGDKVVVRGTLAWVNRLFMIGTPKGAFLENSTLVSVTPAK